MTLTHTITYEHHRLVGFTNCGLPIYIIEMRTQVIYACTESKLQTRINSFYGDDRLAYRRHKEHLYVAS